MDLSQQCIHDVVHPTAAFSSYDSNRSIEGALFSRGRASWKDSPLNPKNRIDSLDPPKNPLWRIDGSTAFGTQLYAVPLFVSTAPPFRVDVFLPEPATLPAYIRDVLDIDMTFYTRDGSRTSRLGITCHVLRILQHWSAKQKNPMLLYQNLPFGSRIVFHNLPKNVADARISIAPTHYLERQLLSAASLKSFWGDDITLPQTVDIDKVEFLSQLHDSVCLVKIAGRTLILKALTSYTKYLYHELRQLLVIPKHANIISHPAHLITKKCGFGNKVAIIGFTLEYHVNGSLRDLVPFLQLHGRVSLADKTKWSLQLTSAVLHLRNVSRIFYPDLRMDNIVLSESRDAIMVDFEQRGVWCEFAAPEVNAIEYIRLLAVDEEIDAQIRDTYAHILSDMLPDWEEMGQGEEYSWPSKGYNIPWACLTSTEAEACEVYMLGRVLWCIFEACSAPQRAAVWLSYRWEPQVEFPNYTITPKPIRQIIDACTRGRQVGLSEHIVRERNKLVMRSLEKTGESTAKQVQESASKWWAEEIGKSEKWLKERSKGLKNGTWNENYYNRPSLQEVYDSLASYKKESGFVF